MDFTKIRHSELKEDLLDGMDFKSLSNISGIAEYVLFNSTWNYIYDNKEDYKNDKKILGL